MFQIEWTNTASKQRIDILEFWNNHNKSQTYSKKLFKETLRIEKLLIENPYLGSFTDFEEVKKIIVLKNFSIYFKLQNNIITILAFRDNRSNPESLNL
jgi:hypothetical protein